MGKIIVGSVVKALPESNTWMHQYDVVGLVTKIFCKDGKVLAKISIPKWLVRRNRGKHIIHEWVREGWSKPEDDFLLLNEGVDLTHLEISEMPEPTTEEKVDCLVYLAFGAKGNNLGINVIFDPKDLVVTPGICVHEGCNQERTHLVWHNNHGTVEAFMVCESHYEELNGRCSDGFPIKVELLVRAA